MTAMASAPVPAISGHQLLVFLLQAGLLLALGYGLARLARPLGWPAIVAELAAGVLAGPSVLRHLAPALSGWLLPRSVTQFHLLDAVGQVGVILLVGVTGIQLDLSLVRRHWHGAVRTGTIALVVPLGLGIAAGFFLPASLIPAGISRGLVSLLVGVALGVSALPVIAKTLADLGLLRSHTGQLILCAVAVDDALGWLLLSLVAAMAAGAASAGHLGMLAAGTVAAVAVGLAVRPALRAMLAAASRSAEGGPVVAVVVIAILLAAAGSQAIGLEAVFGAFACGVLISSCGGISERALASLSVPVLYVLAPLYFATVGLRLDLTALARPEVALTGLALLAIAAGGKLAGAYAGARISGLRHWQAVALGAGMNSRGVIEVIVATIGLQAGLLSPALFTVIILIAIATSLMTPPLLHWAVLRSGDPAAQGRAAAVPVPVHVPAPVPALAHHRPRPALALADQEEA